MSRDLTFIIGAHKFNVRTAALIFNGDRVLLQNASFRSRDYWSLCGGRIQIGENSFSALQRELKEELDLTPKSITLLRTVENFFTSSGYSYHEYLFIYRVDIDPKVAPKYENFSILDKEGEYTKWFDVTETAKMELRPSVLHDCIENRDGLLHHSVLKS